MATWDAHDIADRLQIADLLAAYTHGIDARDFELVASCFTPDATCDYSPSGGPVADLPTTLAWLRESLGQVAFTQHYVTNQRITVDGDRATSHAYFFHPLRVSPGDAPLLMGGRYHDRLVRTPEGWRITDRKQDLTWVQGIDASALGITTEDG